MMQEPILRSACILFFCQAFATTLFLSNMPYLFINVLKINESQLSVCFSMLGIGAIIGSLLSAKIISKAPYGKIIIISDTLQGIYILLSMLTPSAFYIAGLWAILTCNTSVVIVSFFTLRQRIVPAKILGRVVATSRLISYSSIPLAAVTGGYIIENGGSINLILSIAGLIVCLLISVRFINLIYAKNN